MPSDYLKNIPACSLQEEVTERAENFSEEVHWMLQLKAAFLNLVTIIWGLILRVGECPVH